ncbi:hypothetical protein AWB79_02239 [Caballeronia hypogeia]|uniref:DUF3022 domain-containing protein n=1 Tax=Caballeronia hypogeia TaxID=1777140 RepID=A0A158ADM4_9BURK|nr:hypothetical protein [Caballeronia hypogeia]SAK55938.1 hypothetical protein AWB79_02239 [Caballeronia hypogeia]
MKAMDHAQRVEELQLALSRTFGSTKTPAVGMLDDGDDVVLTVSWVVETGRDTTLDARCSASVRFAGRDVDRYAALDTVQRRTVQDRMIAHLKDAFDQSRAGQPNADECSLAIRADSSWLDVPDTL